MTAGGVPDRDALASNIGGGLMSNDRWHWRTALGTPLTRLATVGVAGVLVAACAAPGAVSTPSAAASATQAAPSSTAAGGSASAGGSPSASAAAAGPDCGTDPVKLNAYFETGFDLPFKLSEEFTKQYPERDLGHQAGPVHESDERDAPAPVRRQPARPDPPAVDGLARQGQAPQESRRLRHGVRMGQVPARAAGAEPCRRGWHARLRLALCDGPELQPDRRVLQQEARRSRSACRSPRRPSPSSRTS